MREPDPASDTSAEPGWIQRVFGSREFFALFNVQLISAIGDWVGFFAITALAASISSQPEAAIALVMTARIAPGILFTPFIGVVVDRFSRKTVMMVSDLVRCGVFLLLPLVRTVPGLVIASLIIEVFTMMWSPAKEATVPSIVPPEKLTTANSLGLVAGYATMPVAGPIQFGLSALNRRLVELGFLGALGFTAANQQAEVQTVAFWFNALTFVVAALILWRWVFPGMPSSALAAPGEEGVERDPVEEERSRLRRTWDEIREGWEFIFVNPVVRGVNIGLATGLIGGAMLVPLGPTFARFVIGRPDTFPLFITALGLGVAVGVVALSALQQRLPKEQVFPLLVFGAGVSMFVGVSMSTFWLAALGVFGLGLCAGSVYVLGFTLLQEHTDDELRGRIFATLLTLVRLCVLLALAVGPALATVFNGFAKAATGDDRGVPEISLFGFHVAIPGVRLTLWLAAVILCVAGVLAGRSMHQGLRSGLRQALESTGGRGTARANHPAAWPMPSAGGAGTTDDGDPGGGTGHGGAGTGDSGVADAGAADAGPDPLAVAADPTGVAGPARLPPPGEVTGEIPPIDLPHTHPRPDDEGGPT